MKQGEVVVSQLWDISCYSSIDVVWVTVVFEVFVVSKDHNGERGT
jgi:hypothetical protein